MKNVNLQKNSSLIKYGILGCLCYGFGDWLMMYGNPTYEGNLIWLTNGTANFPQWRYSLSMFLAFPGIIFYGIALFAIEDFIYEDKHKKIYHYLNIFGLTPWIALHLFYVMILSLFSWMNKNGYKEQAIPVCEGLFSKLSWVIIISEIMMIPVFIYWFYLQVRGKTIFSRGYAFTNVIFIFIILKLLLYFIPISAFRLGFTNGLMNESMIIWFVIILNFIGKKRNNI